MIATADVDTLAEMATAKQVAEDLHSAYPGHAWAVTVRGGLIVVKDLYISSLYGIPIFYNEVKHDAKVMKQEVLRAGGEILERARLERGMRTDRAVTQVDGIANYTGLGQF